MSASRGKGWLLLGAVLGCGALAGWFAPRDALDWQPGLAAAQPWRWWSAAFVHASPLHLAGNLAGLVLVAALGRVAMMRGVLALAWLASWPLTHLSLLLRPELLHYGGLSGVLHAGVAVAAVYLVQRGVGRVVWIGWAVLAGLMAKIMLEQPWGPTLRIVAGSDVAVVPLAHAAGAGWGALAAVLALARDAPSEPPGDAAQPLDEAAARTAAHD